VTVKIGVQLGAARDKYPVVWETSPRLGVWAPSQPLRPATPGKLPSPREENPSAVRPESMGHDYALERVPIKWNHLIDKDSLKIKELEHVRIEKVEQLFRDMLE
jgi:hypothetical protein